MRIFVTCVALKTARGFVVLSEFEVHSRLLLTQGSVVLVSYVVAAKLSFLTCHLIIVYFRKYFRIFFQRATSCVETFVSQSIEDALAPGNQSSAVHVT